MLRALGGVALSPASRYGTSQGSLENGAEERSTSASRQRLTALAGDPRVLETWNSLELFFCVGVDAPASSWPQALRTSPQLIMEFRGISNMRVYFQEPRLSFHQLALVSASTICHILLAREGSWGVCAYPVRPLGASETGMFKNLAITLPMWSLSVMIKLCYW